MSDPQDAGFGKFVPGFEFLQNLAKGASEVMPQMPDLANWIAPTLNAEELDKRIAELKAVHFWLDQNSRALAATVQALEVQKMTLATLKGMNFNVGDLASTLAAAVSGAQKTTRKAGKAAKPATPAASGLVDPLQLWGALTQQFQQIAASALKEAATARHKAEASPARAPVKKAARKTAGRGR